jgi:enoyl-CoA hydratase
MYGEVDMEEHRFETLLVEPVGPAVVLTINRPGSLNALNRTFLRELCEILDEIAADPHVRAVVLTGAGRGFCSGIDFSNGSDEAHVASDVREVLLRAFRTGFAQLIPRLTSLPQPVIAAVNGPAAGAGLALALAADIRVCSESARFGASFVRLGLSGCELGVSYLLPRIVGATLAFEMMLTGRFVEAAEAQRHGLVLDVVGEGHVVEAALQVATNIARNSPFGVCMTKEVMRSNLDAPNLMAAMHLENRTQALCFDSPDGAEARVAFIERRKPNYVATRATS